jgi:hypothetical protein
MSCARHERQFAGFFSGPSALLCVELDCRPQRFRKARRRHSRPAKEKSRACNLSKDLQMPADHASGRFALLLNGLSRKAFPLGSTAALSLLISTAAHADQCLYTRTSAAMVLAQATTVSTANACILDEGNMRAASGSCRTSATPAPITGTPFLPAQQSATR